VEAYIGTHPMPSHDNVQATQVIIGIAQEATERDLVIVVVAGGGSALLCSSIEECDQNGALFELAKREGATIQEMNVVRRHLSTLKGGGLARELYPATVVGLVFSDIVGGNPQDVASGPTYFDESTVDDAKAVLERLGAVDGFTLTETPKDQKYFENVTNHVLVSNEDSLKAMAIKAEALGYHAVALTEPVYSFADEAFEIMNRSLAPKTVVLAGGEIRLKVPDDHGVGGRCQYFALHSLSHLDERTVCVGAASDGRDNCDAAGAIVDSGTNERIKTQQLDIARYTQRMDTYPIFEKTGDSIMTGQTNANVSDWYMLLRD
jgi:glycerate-2-kinase